MPGMTSMCLASCLPPPPSCEKRQGTPMCCRSQQTVSVAGTHGRCFRFGLAADPSGMCQDPQGHFHESLHLHKATHLHSREIGPLILKHPSGSKSLVSATLPHPDLRASDAGRVSSLS